MTTKPLPDPAYLRQRLRYEPETGKLFWREWPAHGPRWNGKCAGKEAFTSLDTGGYRHGHIDRKMVRAHRVAWAIYYGEWPAGEVDHSNHIRADNRLVNLRVVNATGNQQNQSIYRNNTSGIVGVCWRKGRASGAWRAYIQGDGRRINLGHFADFDEAVAARKAAEAKYGFHENHGHAGPG